MRYINKSQLYFINDVRMLWEQHSTWIGMAITSIVFKLPNEEVVIDRLLQNPVDFAVALEPFYGEKTSSIFATLLTQQLILATEFIKAIPEGNSSEITSLELGWYENADEISKFLDSINPFWSEKDWQKIFHEHLSFVEDLGLLLIKKDFNDKVIAFGELEKASIEMADMMSVGVLKQFPNKFPS